jgi:protocatechuate 3,4-dioxygenase beta subunit
VLDVHGDPVVGTRIGFWNNGFGQSVFTDDTGLYLIELPYGDYKFDVTSVEGSELGYVFSPNVHVAGDVVRDVALLPSDGSFSVVGDPFLGKFADGQQVSAVVSVSSQSFSAVNVPPEAIEVWVHDWSDPLNWWDDPVVNDYHYRVASPSISVQGSDLVVSFLVDTSVAPFSHSGRLDLEVKIGGQGVYYGFNSIIGPVHTISGSVEELGHTPVVGAWVSVYNGGSWFGGSTDGSGHYSFVAAEGIYQFSIEPPEGSTIGSHWEGGLAISADLVKDVVLTQPLQMQPADGQQGFLGKTASTGMIMARFTVTAGNPAQPVTGLTRGLFEVWIHNWDDPTLKDQDPSNDWWQNQVENQYHGHAAGATITGVEGQPGVYVLNYVLGSDTFPEFDSSSHYSLDVRSSGAGVGFGFDVFSGTAYQISGIVNDLSGNPVSGAQVSIWRPGVGDQPGDWFGGQTDTSGHYSFVAAQGTYQFNANAQQESGLGGYWTSSFTVSADVVKDVVLIPQLNVQQLPGQGFLGNFPATGTLTASFTVSAPGADGDPGTPVTGLTRGLFEVWIHNWDDPTLKDQDPSNDWWQNQVENQYHGHATHATIAEVEPGLYTLTYALGSDTYPTMSGGHMSLDLRIGYAGMGWGFDVFSGTAYQISGIVNDLSGNPVSGAQVSIWRPGVGDQPGDWFGGATDSNGHYSFYASQGIYQFNANPQPPMGGGQSSLGGYWEGGFTVSADVVKNVVLAPQLQIQQVGQQGFLGKLPPTSTLQVFFTVSTQGGEGDPGSPVTGLTRDMFQVWIHNWDDPTLKDQDPSNDWWQNQVENQYHGVASHATITAVEGHPGEYLLTYVLGSDDYPDLSSGGHLSLDLRAGNAGIGWGFDVFSGTAYQISGTVTDLDTNPVGGIQVSIWSPGMDGQPGDWFGGQTDVDGHYSFYASPGTYQFGANPQPPMGGDQSSLSGYWEGGFIVASDTIKNIVLTPQLQLQQVGQQGFLGKVPSTSTLQVSFTVSTIGTEGYPGSPVTGLTREMFDVWIHNWDDPTLRDQDPSNDWWQNQVENQYHGHATLATITSVEGHPGMYTLSYVLGSQQYPDLLSGGHMSLDLRIGNTGMGWGFDVFTGTAYQISGIVNDLSGNPVSGAQVSIWRPGVGDQPGDWFGGQTDASGHYVFYAAPGTYQLGANPPPQEPGSPSLGGHWEANFVVSESVEKNVILTPQLQIYQVGQQGFLGAFKDTGMLTARFRVFEGDGQTPVTGLTSSLFEVWIHNWDDPTLKDQDPSNDWWNSQVPNQYHGDASAHIVLVESQDEQGLYTLTYVLGSDQYPDLSSGGHFSLDVRVGGSGMGWGFDVITGDVYTVSGRVTDMSGHSLEDVQVNIWSPGSGESQGVWFGGMTDAQGQYSFVAAAGTYQFGVNPTPESGLGGYGSSSFAVSGDVVKDVVLTPQLNIQQAEGTQGFLGNLPATGTLTARFTVSTIGSEGNPGVPVTGLSRDMFDVWIHNWDDPTLQDQDPSNDWWQNQVENQYHGHAVGAALTEDPEHPGLYTITYVLGSDQYPSLDQGGHMSLDVRVGNGGMGWGFSVFSGIGYEVSGVVSDMSGNPVGGIEVNMWAQEFGSGGISDESGHYSIYVPAGTYNIGVKPNEVGDYFEQGISVDSDLTKDIRLIPSMVIDQVGQDPWLGFYQSGGTLTANFVISSTSGQPMTGFDTSLLDIWVHNPNDPTLTDSDPSNDWWANPVENQYHTRITSDVTYTEEGNGVYGLSYVIDGSNPIFSSGGHFDLEIRGGKAGVHLPFGLIVGEAYSVSGSVTSDGQPVVGAKVGVWNSEYWFGSETDQGGLYQFTVAAGDYQFGVDAPEGSGLGSYYEQGFSVTGNVSGKIVALSAAVKYTVSGTVTDEQQQPIAGATVVFNSMSDNGFATTDESGAYMVSVLGDVYDVVVLPPQGGQMAGYYQPEYIVSQDTVRDFTLKAMPSPVYQVSGTVRDPAQNTLSDARVVFISGNDLYMTQTNSDGAFQMGVPEGTYYFRVEPPDGSPLGVHEEQQLQVSGPMSLEITLPQGGSPPPQSTTLSGHVTGPSGALVGATVILDYGEPQAIITMTDGQGNYQLQASSGSHTLAVLPPQGVQVPGHIEDVLVQNVPLTVDVTLVALPGPSYSLSGTVTNNQGGLVANARVSLVQGQYILGGKTNAVGVYNMGCLSGAGTLMVNPPDGSGLTGNKLEVDLVDGPNVVDVVLSPP